MTEANTELPARPAELTLAFLQRVLMDVGVAPRQRVAAFSWKGLEVGVISEVVGLDIELVDDDATGTDGASTQKSLIAKFLRPEFPFERMFEVESNFYNGFASSNEQKAAFPFGLPKALFLSKQLIIMERVGGIDTFSCVEGCPESQILNVVTKLAQMHGRFWKADTSSLAPCAGIGSELAGDAKQQQFPGCWRAYLDDVSLDEVDRERVARLCEKLSEDPARLTRIHDAVANGPTTLIHGDFHTGNVLFARHDQASEGSNDLSQLWLVDWATCGKGNPLRDLAFLFIVGVRSEHRAAVEAASLRTYAETIKQEGVDHLSLADWTRHYKACVLNQFVILVVYDHLSKHLASNAKSEKLRQELHAHFREVNARACLAVLEHFDVAAIEQL